jgi:hypothetical protein
MNALQDSLRRDDFKPATAARAKTRKVMHWQIGLDGRGRFWIRLFPYRKAQRALRLLKKLGFEQAYMVRFGRVEIRDNS